MDVLEQAELVEGVMENGEIRSMRAASILNNQLRQAYMDTWVYGASTNTVNWRGEEPTEEQKQMGVQTLEKVKSAVKIAERKEEVPTTAVETLASLGFKTAAHKAKKDARMFAKINMAIVAGYTQITEEDYMKYNLQLREKTNNTLRLDRVGIEDYEGIPPLRVLDELKIAQKPKIFDSFHIISVQKVPDPILVGMINGSQDMFFIAEWGEDVSLQDLVA